MLGAFPRGIVSLGPLRLGDVVLGGGRGLGGRWVTPGTLRVPDGSCARPRAVPRERGQCSRSQSRPLPPSCGEKHRGSRPCTVATSCPRARQDGDPAGTPEPEPWWPKKGPCLIPTSPCSTCRRVHQTFRFTYFALFIQHVQNIQHRTIISQ